MPSINVKVVSVDMLSNKKGKSSDDIIKKIDNIKNAIGNVKTRIFIHEYVDNIFEDIFELN